MFSRFNPFGKAWFSQLEQLQQEMGRAFDRFSTAGFSGAVAAPALNVWEEGDTLNVEAELPGMDLADLEIFVTGQNHLTIKGQRKFAVPEKHVQHRQERQFGSFVRAVTLPMPVDADRVDARLENGILTVQLPKHESAKPRKIAVKG